MTTQRGDAPRRCRRRRRVAGDRPRRERERRRHRSDRDEPRQSDDQHEHTQPRRRAPPASAPRRRPPPSRRPSRRGSAATPDRRGRASTPGRRRPARRRRASAAGPQHGHRSLHRVEHIASTAGRTPSVRSTLVAPTLPLPDVAQIDPPPPRQQKGERDRSHEIRGDDREQIGHRKLAGTRAGRGATATQGYELPATGTARLSTEAVRCRGTYVAPFGDNRLSNSVIASTCTRAELPGGETVEKRRPRRPAGSFTRRQRQMRAVRRGPREARASVEPLRDRALDLEQAVAAIGQTRPEHTRRSLRRKRADALDGQRRTTGASSGRRQRRADRLCAASLVDLADESDRHVECARAPTQVTARARRELRDATRAARRSLRAPPPRPTRLISIATKSRMPLSSTSQLQTRTFSQHAPDHVERRLRRLKLHLLALAVEPERARAALCAGDRRRRRPCRPASPACRRSAPRCR